MKIRHFYHVFAGGGWAGPAREHIEALGRAGFPGEIVITLIGPARDRERAREMIALRLAGWDLPEPEQWIEADQGHEQVTLAVLREYALECEDDQAILYAHTKGAHSNAPINEPWRRSMTRHVVGDWRYCVKLLSEAATAAPERCPYCHSLTEPLAEPADTVGCHWLTREEHHRPPDRIIPTPMYGGNFWWGRTDYLKRLPVPGTDYRHQAEEWVGLGAPRAFDLLPGWPSMALFAPEETAAEADKLAACNRDAIAAGRPRRNRAGSGSTAAT